MRAAERLKPRRDAAWEQLPSPGFLREGETEEQLLTSRSQRSVEGRSVRGSRLGRGKPQRLRGRRGSTQTERHTANTDRLIHAVKDTAGRPGAGVGLGITR